MVACNENRNEDKFVIHIWKGPSVDIDEEEIARYIEEIKEAFFLPDDRDKVEEIEELPLEESDELFDLL
jgi:hypothetical protein